jgi:hypothetical protein
MGWSVCADPVSPAERRGAPIFYDTGRDGVGRWFVRRKGERGPQAYEVACYYSEGVCAVEQALWIGGEWRELDGTTELPSVYAYRPIEEPPPLVPPAC